MGTTNIDTAFDQFWAVYPLKRSKGFARKAFVKAMAKTTIDVILKALEWQVKQPKWAESGGAYIPFPATWLNQERWLDEHLRRPTVRKKNLDTMAAIFEDGQ